MLPVRYHDVDKCRLERNLSLRESIFQLKTEKETSLGCYLGRVDAKQQHLSHGGKNVVFSYLPLGREGMNGSPKVYLKMPILCCNETIFNSKVSLYSGHRSSLFPCLTTAAMHLGWTLCKYMNVNKPN